MKTKERTTLLPCEMNALHLATLAPEIEDLRCQITERQSHNE